MEPFIGQIMMFGGNFAPRGWAFCNGQLISISQNQALFSLIGTIYGGDGRTTFALPDLRGRVPMGMGRGLGLTEREIGQRFGSETQALTSLNLPPHNHTATVTGGTTNTQTNSIQLSADNAIRETPIAGDVPAVSNYPDGLAAVKVKSFGPANNIINGQEITFEGGGTPTVAIGITGHGSSFSIEQPSAVVNYVIALQGTFPSRS